MLTTPAGAPMLEDPISNGGAVIPEAGADSAAQNAPAVALADAPVGAGQTPVALLGTLGHLHSEPLHYDLRCLQHLVETLEPDLLGVEIDPVAWARGDLSGAPLEVARALIPAARRTATVIVPLGGAALGELARGAGTGWRRAVGQGVEQVLTVLQRAVDGPAGVNSPAFGHLCGLLCGMQEAATDPAGRAAWEAANTQILDHLVQAVRRDPGRRMLVAVNCRRVHWLSTRLRAFQPEIRLVPYTAL